MMMNFIKKHKLAISLVGVLMLAIATIGTIAYFSKSFTSDKNVAVAAKFDVEAVNGNGETIGNRQFDLGEDLIPGMETIEAYSFQINKNNTTLPVEYMVNLEPSGKLFGNNSPIELTLQRSINNQWVDVDYSTTFRPESDTESYRILVDWPHSDNDIDFQGAKGNIKLEVVASQVDPEEEPAGPPYYTGDIIFKATPNGSTRTTTNKEVNFYINDQGYKVIEVTMGDGTSDFENKVGDFKVIESVENGTTWYRVYTDKEYYASETQIWRTSVVDTSTNGVLYFDKTLAPFLSIESQVLYDWFLAN
ncbi:hypothetical protein [Robertmurraya massiliosenegalensis]|uniref:hypothetical protein n=2 Tax=Robertmurraya massiliosenegalensis TaxID=1287657 RepID=UPI0012B625F3|nr:hypothetical protein [Robertmurraya massiliosenegalensis]